MSAPASNCIEWDQGVVELKVAIGEFVLYRLARAAEVYRFHARSDDTELAQRVEADGWQGAGTGAVRYVAGLPASDESKVLLLRNGVLRYSPRRYLHATVDLRDDLEQFWGHLSSKSRTTLRRKLRRCRESLGQNFNVVVFDRSDEISRFFHDARLVAVKTYQEHLLKAALPDTNEYRSRVASLADKRQFYGFILYDGSIPIAYMACPVHGAAALYEYVGFDPKYQALSPGTVLLVKAMEHLASATQVDWFDFTEGDGEHKRTFATQLTPASDVYYFRFGLRVAVAVLCHVICSRVSRLLARTSELLGMKRVLKRYLRSRAVLRGGTPA